MAVDSRRDGVAGFVELLGRDGHPILVNVAFVQAVRRCGDGRCQVVVSFDDAPIEVADSFAHVRALIGRAVDRHPSA